MSWIIFHGGTDGGVYKPIRVMHGFSVSKQNGSILLDSSDLEIISKPTSSTKLQPEQWKNGDVSQMRKHWHSDARSTLVIHSSASDKTLCIELRLHERVNDKSTVYYTMHPRKISYSLPNLWMNPKISFWELLSYNRFNCMTNESFYGDV